MWLAEVKTSTTFNVLQSLTFTKMLRACADADRLLVLVVLRELYDQAGASPEIFDVGTAVAGRWKCSRGRAVPATRLP
jgi:hypothetical protein